MRPSWSSYLPAGRCSPPIHAGSNTPHVPSERRSGERPHRGAITQAGNRRARQILVQAAWGLRRTRGPVAAARRAWAQQLAARRSQRVAVVARARRIAGILDALWRDGPAYEARGVRGVRRPPHVAA